MMRSVLVTALALSSGACANFSPLTKQVTVPNVAANSAQWLTYDSSRRGTLVIREVGENGKPDRVISCAEPAPDTGFSFTNSFKANGSSGGTTIGAEAAFAATLVALAGRDNLVLMTRESMFRLCEARANGFINNDQYNSQFTKLLEQIVEIAQAVKQQSAQATAALVKAQEDRR
ncbi:hypothetical protein GCM10023115_07440 [Pontixanthobacter gangjinensis]|uniref:Lipoprotein n=1 Tax=Pontixanthobacter gangjinensis TaxID=1028742 RepID=A0A6I4SML5_9SPHN|nr:hypothetical protein [Pontixanthobacter gangjinensis]MXO55992.1 hypothetical protein [Pontixanthobacter gangjinensis]